MPPVEKKKGRSTDPRFTAASSVKGDGRKLSEEIGASKTKEAQAEGPPPASYAIPNTVGTGSCNTISAPARARYYASRQEKKKTNERQQGGGAGKDPNTVEAGSCNTISAPARTRYYASREQKKRGINERAQGGGAEEGRCSLSPGVLVPPFLATVAKPSVARISEEQEMSSTSGFHEKIHSTGPSDTVSTKKRKSMTNAFDKRKRVPEHHAQGEEHHLVDESLSPIQNDGCGFASPVQEDGEMTLETEFLSRTLDLRLQADDVEGRPGAFRVGGRRDDDDDIDSSTDDEYDDGEMNNYDDVSVDEEVHELPAELVTGANHNKSELRQLRQALENIVEAQMIPVAEKDSNEEASSSTSPYGKWSCACGCCILLLLAVVAVVLGTTFGLIKSRSSPAVPTASPTRVAEATAVPSSLPTAAPTTAPSSAMVPTQEPTLGDCDLGVTVACDGVVVTWDDGVVDKYSCSESIEIPDIRFDPCFYPPFRASLLFNGGDCSQSDNANTLNFTCVDTPAGSPPRERGIQSYIVVKDTAGKDLVYFDGFVRVGEEYNVTATIGGLLEDGIWISIYRPEDTGELTLLQEVKFYSKLCANSEQNLLELVPRFGASQLLSYENNHQGELANFVGSDTDVMASLTIHLDAAPGTMMIHKLTLVTNFAGFLNLTEVVAGTLLTPGGTVSFNYPFNLDLTERRRYTVLAQIAAVLLEDPSYECFGKDFNSF